MAIWKQILIILISINVGIFIGFLLDNEYDKDNQIKEQLQQIEILENKIDSLKFRKDSIVQKIDTIYVEIEKVKIRYEENRTTILNNTPSEDYLFFTEYIRRFNNNI